MPVTPALLQGLAASLRAVRLDPPVAPLGQFTRLTITPDPGLLRAVDADMVTAPLSLGLAGAITGSITGPLPVAADVPIEVKVSWAAYRVVSKPFPGAHLPDIRLDSSGRRSGRVVTSASGVGGATTVPDATTGTVALAADVQEQEEELVLGEDFIAPDGVDVPDVSFLFVPQYTELTVSRLPSVTTVRVYATVTLTVDGQEGVAVKLPAVTVLVPALPVPKLLALFRYSDFNLALENGAPRSGQAVLLVVPGDALLGAYEALQPALRTIRAALTPLHSIRRCADLLLGVNRLTGALSRRPRLRYKVADRIDDLHKVKLITVTRWEDPWVNDEIPDVDIPLVGSTPGNNSDNDIYAGDRMSSLLFIAPPGAQVECFNNRNCRSGDGRLVVTTGVEGVVMIRSLRIDPNDAAPDTVPPDRAEASPPPPSGSGFDDRLSSLRF